MNRTSAPTWLAAVGIVLAVIALWHPGTLILAGVRYRLALNLPWWVLAALATASLAVLLAIVALLIATPRRKRPAGSERKPPPPLRLSPLALTVLVLLLSSWAAAGMLVFHLIDPDLLAAWLVGTTEKTWLLSLPQDAGSGPDVMEMPAVNQGVAVALAILAAVLTGCALLVIFLNEPWAAIAGWFRHSKRESRCLDDVASAISAAAQELELGDDPRHAVIACYRRCETALASQRRRRYNSETPREFVYDTLTALALPENAVRSLLSVFERARFSDLPITQTDRSIAQGALTEIRSVLESENQDGAHA
jgi:uncharacterized protein DUF4129